MIINITIEMESLEVVNFERWLRENVNVKDFTVIPDTNELYQNDNTFKSLCKKVSDAKRVRDSYYNEKR
jgi:DNA-binding transcriptional regulator LsrR (DeoR family)|tara:strand:- start:480 stop:686 length:207 start_codon:yes stop_codon:yes gene_type:complete